MAGRQPKRGVEITSRERPILALRGKAVLATDSDGEQQIELRGDLVEECPFRTSPEFLATVAAIRSPESALRFVARYGLLFKAAALETMDGSKGEWRSKAAAHIWLSEPLEAYLGFADELSETRRLYDLSQRAWYGDPYSIASLRSALADITARLSDDEEWAAKHREHIATLDRETLAAQAARHVVRSINRALEALDARFYIVLGPTAPGFALHPDSPSLAGQAWLQVAAEVTQQLSLRECRECGAIFAVTDPRQRYCSRRCSGRSRARRFRTTHADPKHQEPTR